MNDIREIVWENVPNRGSDWTYWTWYWRSKVCQHMRELYTIGVYVLLLMLLKFLLLIEFSFWYCFWYWFSINAKEGDCWMYWLFSICKIDVCCNDNGTIIICHWCQTCNLQPTNFLFSSETISCWSNAIIRVDWWRGLEKEEITKDLEKGSVMFVKQEC